MSLHRIAIIAIAALAALGLVIWAFLPQPVAVDMAVARVAPMQVSVAAEGVTRVRESYLVTAPISGTATRSPVQVGDALVGGETVVAVIQPAEPAFLDARARRQAEAAVTEAEAALRLAEVNVARAEADLTHGESQHARNLELAARGIIAQAMLENSQLILHTHRRALDAAESEVEMTRATLERMRAQLVGPDTSYDPGAVSSCCVEINAPHSGTVLSVANTSARLVQAGEPLLSIGDLSELELEVDLLSADAVKVAPGARAYVERWGGDEVLQARVRRIDPAAFTKVSALGIEEQRVRLKLDFLTPPADRPGLGDAYRVFVRVIVWEDPAVLQVPLAALFRSENGWAVFRVENRRAVLTPVDIGQQTTDAVQILSGLNEGDTVVLYPGDKVSDGVRLTDRSAI